MPDHDEISRRDFMTRAAVAGAAITTGLPLPTRAGDGGFAISTASVTRAAPTGVVQPFPLSDVKLLPGMFADAAELNRKFMLSMDVDRLLHVFRVNAGLPSSATPFGGWEAPNNELRGHFVGHYLSGCAMRWASFGDAEFKRRGDTLVAELAKCQATFGNGYLSAFPEELFDRLRADVRVWAPFYTLHKIMAGLLDMHTLAGNQQAGAVLLDVARWVDRWTQPLGDAHMQRVLEREYGGMNEVLYNLAAVTKDDRWIDVGHRFDHTRFFNPLADGRDELKGLHVNTQIPKVIGAARRYELTGEERYRDIAEYFWHEVTGRRSYCTGGTSNGEGWNSEPGKLAGELSGYTQECCVTYNMLRLTRDLFRWTADPRLADYYERAMLNGIMGTQHPSDGHNLYYVPLQSGYWKLFGQLYDSFWCCNGSSMESFGKLGDSIYFHDDAGVYVNQFVASELTWKERNVRLVQETRFPDEDTTRLTIRGVGGAPGRFALKVRIPYWATRGGSVRINGKALEAFAAPSSYLVLDREWKDGDKVEVTMPMSLHLHAMPDDASIAAVMYGPVVLAGRMGADGLTPAILRAEKTAPRTVPEYKGDPIPAPDLKRAGPTLDAWVTPVAGQSLTFHPSGQARQLELVPLYRILDERYAVYWKFA